MIARALTSGAEVAWAVNTAKLRSKKPSWSIHKRNPPSHNHCCLSIPPTDALTGTHGGLMTSAPTIFTSQGMLLTAP